jgi:hypothetical protein
VRRPDEAEDVFESQKARYRRAIDKLQHENVGYTGGSYYGPALSVGVIGAVVGFFLGVKDVGVGWFWNAVIGYAAITVPALMLAVRADGQHYAAYHAALEANAQKHAPTIHRLEQKLTLLQNTYYG